MPEKNSINYDDVVYPNFVHAQTHPNRLATMARAYGLKTASVENCRVLEVGCGSGTNLLAMAANLPDSEFVGIDLSENHIKFGLQAAQEIGVTNLNLVRTDLLEADISAFGKFDYIIAHGFYSWIPPVVREKFLEICRVQLAENGVAFVSYNALPGCHLRLMMREMMTYHTENIESPQEKINQSLSLLGFLKDAAFEKEVYGKILENEFEKTIERAAEVIIHDDLGTFNQPFYFHEFVAAAEKNDLQFLSEAEYFHEKYTSFNGKAVGLLNQFGDDETVRREQYLDFLKNRRFRQTLICHKNANVKRKVVEDFFDEIKVVCDLYPQSETPDLAPKINEKFSKSENKGATLDHPLTKAALFYLCGIFPRSVSFNELVENSKELVRKQLGETHEFSETDVEILKDVLMKIFASDLVNFFIYEPQIASEVSEKPKADEFILWQAKNSDTIFSRRFRTKKIEDDFARNLMILCDGEHTREQIVEDFKEKISDGRIIFEDETIEREFIENLPEAIENQLQQAAKLGLFIS